MKRRSLFVLTMLAILTAGCAHPAHTGLSPAPAAKPLQTSADVEWTGPGPSRSLCGAFALTFTFKAVDPQTRSRVQGKTLTIQLSTAIGKSPTAVLVPGGPLDGFRSTQAFNAGGVASFTFTTTLPKGLGFVRWNAAAQHPVVMTPAVAAGRQC
jgi:hypothetical protein